MQVSGLQRLPDDVLIRIITIIRDRRPPLDSTKEISRQRPNMLLILMRVSSRIHNLIIPFIYTSSITITSSAKFFYGINLYPANGCIWKADRLKLIKQIKFAYPFNPSMESSELHQEDWDDVILYKQSEEVLKHYVSLLDQVEISIRLLKGYKLNSSGRKLFVGVMNLSFLPMKEWEYSKHHSLVNPKLARWGVQSCDSPRINHLLDDRLVIQKDFQELLGEMMEPIHTCDHSSHGPYCWNPSDENTSIIRPITYTTEIGRHHIRYKLSIPFLPYSTTRLIIREETIENFKPKEDWFLTPQELGIICLEGFLKWFRTELTKTIRNLPWSHGNGDKEELSGQTRIIIYIPTEMQYLTSITEKLRSSITGKTAGMSKNQIYEELSKWLIGKKSSGFKGKAIKVDIALRKEKGECPACGDA